jgi:hypothetical protein
MSIQQVIYSSRPVPSLTIEDVDTIVASSQAWNQSRGITGRLLVVTDSGDALLAFMKRIAADPRHTAIHVVQNAPVPERSYPEWSMHQEVLSAEQVEDALAAAGINGRVDVEGVIVVEGEVIRPNDPSGA